MEDMRGYIEGGLVDVVQVDLTHFGGFLAMKRLAGWADAYSLLLAPHNVCGPVGTMANLHLAVSTPNYKVLEHFNDFADGWATDGCFAAPDRPGLGLRLDHDACRRHPSTGGRIRLFEQGWEKRANSPTSS
jgi:galactonate dehydratase